MSKEREIPEEKKGEEPEAESFQPVFAQSQENSSTSDSKQLKTMAEAFRETSRSLFDDIYKDFYTPIGAYDNLPPWAKPAAALPKGGEEKEAEKKVPEKKSDKKDDFAPPSPSKTDPELPAQPDQKRMPYADEKPAEQPAKPVPNPGGEPPIEFKPDNPESKPEDSKAGKVSRDGNKIRVEYPGAEKTREITLDANGKAEQIVTKDRSGTTTLVRRGDKWNLRVQGMELQMPGNVEADAKGDVTFDMGQGVFRREKPDGSSVQEKTNADGSRTSFYESGQVEKLTRKDGSSIQLSADGKSITESLPNSNRQIAWTKQADGSWQSDTQPAQKRSNFKVDAATGATSWDGPEGLKYVVRGDGSMMVQGEGQAKIELDEQNRIKSIDYGSKKREFDYFDNTNEIKKTSITDKEKNSTSTFERPEAGSNKWKVNNGGQTWTGEIKIGPGGAYSYKPDGSSITAGDKDGRWYTMWPDGKVTRDTISDDGSRMSYDNNKLVKALAKDGTSAQISDTRISISNPRSGEQITWTKEGDLWKSDSPKFPGAKKDLSVNEKCELSFTAEDGSKHMIRPDGKEVISRKDGVQLELNEAGKIDRITKGDSVRDIERGPDGSILRVMDKNKNGESIVLQRRPGDSISSVEMSPEGDIVIKNKDNSSTLERANFTSVSRDKDGMPTRMTNQRGDSRDFKYAGDGPQKQLIEIQDTKKTSKGDVLETWTRKDGTNDFASIGKNGKEKIRENVQLLPDGSGDYSYKNKDGGKDRIAKLGSDAGDSALSESVEEAREALLDEMRDKLSETNYKRFEEMMKGFEQRMSDRAYLRKMGGITGAEAVDTHTQKTVQETYDNLRSMVSKGDDAFMDQKTRVKLAENFMFNAMEPTAIDQGPASQTDWNGHGTCWITTGEIWGMTQHPGAMADYLKQVTTEGKYTTKSSGEKDATPITYSFSPKLLTFDGKKQESKWTIENATTEWRQEGNMKTQIWGDRSPVSKIFQYTLPVLSGSRKEFDVDGGLYETANLVGQGWTRGVRDIMHMVTGDVPVDRSYPQHSDGHLLNNNYVQSMLEKGTVLSYTPGHLRSQTVRRVDGKWYLVQDDQHSEKSDSVMSEITDIEKWAAGDKSVEKKVNISKLDLFHKKAWTGGGDADRIGEVTPKRVSSTVSDTNAKPVRQAVQNKPVWSPSRTSRQSYALPSLEIRN